MKRKIQIRIEKRYLLLPVKTGVPKVCMSVRTDTRHLAGFEIELAPQEPDFRAFLDVTRYKGDTLTLESEGDELISDLMRSISQSDEIDDAGDLYREQLRPQFHFTSRRGWNNDPNGLVYHDGEYHMFYQHNPFGWSWGNMHWGHAVSRDLVHWKELPDALAPDELGTIWSGSGFVDQGNTAGFDKDGADPLVLVYTSAGGTSPWSKDRLFTQSLAYSTDRGRSWRKCAGNPVVPYIAGKNRDPKVIKYEPTGQWIMALYLEKSEYALLGSWDLKSWERLCAVRIPGASECPDFYPLRVNEDPSIVKWVFSTADGSYLIGEFDGRLFTPEGGVQRFSFGAAYAAQTWSDIPAEDGRRIQIAWLRGDKPGMPFNQQMSFPMELSLRHTPSGIRLFGEPAREIDLLAATKSRRRDIALREGEDLMAGIAGELLDVRVEMAAAALHALEIRAQGVPLLLDDIGLCLAEARAPLEIQDGKVRLRILVDSSSVEVFAQDGLVYLSAPIQSGKGTRPLEMIARGTVARIDSLVVHELRSTWEPAGTFPRT